MRTVDLSSLVLTDQITRAQAMDSLSTDSYLAASSNRDFAYVADKLGISEDELRSYHAMPLRYYFDYKNLATVFNLAERGFKFFGKATRGGAY